MKRIRIITLAMLMAVSSSSTVFAEKLGFSRISNDLALYKNSNDNLNDKGWTFQIVLINTVRAGGEFQIELTADLNRDLAWEGKDDYYMEIGILKQFYQGFSINYQRIEGTFQPGGINQLGLRYHF